MTEYYIPSLPKSYIGWEASKRLVPEIAKCGPDKRLLLVVDPVVEKAGVLEGIFSDIRESGYASDIYKDIVPEPTLETANKLVDHVRKGNYSVVIGIGGGSALDLAKLAAVFADNDGDLLGYLNLTGDRRIQCRGLFKILIPTTSGTGSEITDISALAIGETKDVIVHEYLKADLAIVDPKLTLSVPPHVTAATGADALTHALEAYLSVNHNPVSDGLALQAIRMIGHSLQRAVEDGQDRKARNDMAYGSYLAGQAFHIAGVGAVHALAYPLGGQFHIPHGISNAVMLPYVLAYIQRHCTARLRDISIALSENIQQLSEQAAAARCIDRLTELVRAIGIPSTLKAFDISESALPDLAARGIQQKRLLGRCPVPLSEQDIYAIYSAAFNGNRFAEGN